MDVPIFSASFNFLVLAADVSVFVSFSRILAIYVTLSYLPISASNY